MLIERFLAYFQIFSYLKILSKLKRAKNNLGIITTVTLHKKWTNPRPAKGRENCYDVAEEGSAPGFQGK